MAHAPIVFISSTSEDLKEYRQQAAKAARALGFLPLMIEDFPASGRAPSLEECLCEVAKAEVVVAIVANRYGWVPDGQTKSITWLECEHAWQVTKKEVLSFVVDPEADWDVQHFESYRLVTERKKPGIQAEVERNEAKLDKFKAKLSEKFRKTFSDAPTLRALVGESLTKWLERQPHMEAPQGKGDSERYLQLFLADTSQIRIMKLKSKRAEPYLFDIEEIYIPLTTLAPGDLEHVGRQRAELERVIRERKVAIIGDPGSGKSTFLRRMAFELCRNLLRTRPKKSTFLAEEDRCFPILIRTADLSKLLESEHRSRPAEAPDWLPYFLGKQSEAFQWGLDEAFFRQRLTEGNCLVMMDGLDEAPDRKMRERVARIFERATGAYAKCDFLVTTRPQSYEGDSVLAGFSALRIGYLELPEIKTFFRHFASALSLPETEAPAFQSALEAALTARPEIREMARNPVMLTALAVLQHNDQRLPEYRVELYESILGWLAAARDNVPGRPSAEKCLEYLRKLALHMQDAAGREGRVVQINKRAAAELAAQEFGGTIERNEDLLERETQDSGIISAVGSDLKFWHLSFQEFLAAREIASFSDREQAERVVKSGRLYQAEWREMLRLLGGLLKQQGTQKIEGLFGAILDSLGPRPRLEQQPRCAALLSAMMRDLRPMGYEPAHAKYEATVKAVMRIFEAREAEHIDIKTRIEAADLLGQVGDPRLDDDNFVVIPAGTFWIGAQKKKKSGRNYDAEAQDDERPLHEVKLKAFRMGRFPVTVHEYAKFMNAGGSRTKKFWPEEFGKFETPADWEEQMRYPSRPVVGVSWYESAAYCQWAGGRLPTEVEWERAARGPQSARYPWGDKPALNHSRANYEMRVGHPTPVGLYPLGHSAEGLADMLGNVYEWCGDWYGTYDETKEEKYKVLRGGSWFSNPRILQVSGRYRREPTFRNNAFGFRCSGELP